MLDSQAGHFAVELRPDAWRMLMEAAAVRIEETTLPRRLQNRTRRGPPRPQVSLTEAAAPAPAKGWVSRVLKVLAPLVVCAAAAVATTDKNFSGGSYGQN